MTKVAIIGYCGVGKTALISALEAERGIEIVNIEQQAKKDPFINEQVLTISQREYFPEVDVMPLDFNPPKFYDKFLKKRKR